jgi:hypothetical protein
MAERITRASNANAHPSMVDHRPPCQSTQEVKAVRQAKTAVEESAKKQKATNIQKVAKLERAVKKKTRDME